VAGCWWGFRFRGERCREYLGLDDNRENRRIAARVLKEIDGELAEVRLRRAISGEYQAGTLRPCVFAGRFDSWRTGAGKRLPAVGALLKPMLSGIYDWFTEGFDTADSKEAKALLDELKS